RHTRSLRDWSSDVCSSDLAVVGVIANLTVFFAWRVFWPMATPQAPFAGHADVASMLIAAAAAAALVSGRLGVIPVIGLAALAGEIGRASCRERGWIAVGAV